MFNLQVVSMSGCSIEKNVQHASVVYDPEKLLTVSMRMRKKATNQTKTV